MTNTSLAIMAHPSRRDLAEPLARRLDAPIVWDRNGVEWETGREALLAYESDADWHVVVQDDAIVPARFREALECVTAPLEPEQPLGLYVGRCRPRARMVTKAVRAAIDSSSPWIEAGGPWWGVAVCLPTQSIPALVASADLYRSRFYDRRVGEFFRLAGRWCRYPIPSLVDHDPDLPSLVDSGGGNRRAHVYIGDRDPRSIDWSRAPVKIDLRGRILVPA